MAYNPIIVPGDGSQTDFSVTFPYLRPEYVKAKVSGTERTFTWVNPGTIRITPPPVFAARVGVYRITPTTPIRELRNGAPVPAADFETLTTQAIHVAEEAASALSDAAAELIEGGLLPDQTLDGGFF